MYISLSQDDVVGAANLDLISVLRVVENPIADFHRADIRTDGDHDGPSEPLSDLSGSRDKDPTVGLPLSVGALDPDQNPVIEHLDRKLVRGLIWGSHGRNASVCAMSSEPGPAQNTDLANPKEQVPPNRIALRTCDGLILRAESAWTTNPTSLAVLCHPHPLHGGNMFAPVVDALFQSLPSQNIACVRFNFRGVTGSDGRHDYGNGEQIDVVAAIDFLVEQFPNLPLTVLGWSFGADVALCVTHQAIQSWIAIAPPLAVLNSALMESGPDPRPKKLFVPEYDQFCDPVQAKDRTQDWFNCSIHVVPDSDHFLANQLGYLCRAVYQAVLSDAATGEPGV